VRVGLPLALLAVTGFALGACGGGGTGSLSTRTGAAATRTGATATQGRTVTVSYTGWLYDPTKPESKGTQFDTSANFVFQLGAGRVIPGWDQGVVGMKVGGQRRLVIPPNLGYGSQMVGSIPPNSTLVFDIMLLNVT
jgi:FKBP-type peptidyl-prolyl cis-trans isomerase FkpA